MARQSFPHELPEQISECSRLALDFTHGRLSSTMGGTFVNCAFSQHHFDKWGCQNVAVLRATRDGSSSLCNFALRLPSKRNRDTSCSVGSSFHIFGNQSEQFVLCNHYSTILARQTPDNRTTAQPDDQTSGRRDNPTTGQPDNRTTREPDNRTTREPNNRRPDAGDWTPDTGRHRTSDTRHWTVDTSAAVPWCFAPLTFCSIDLKTFLTDPSRTRRRAIAAGARVVGQRGGDVGFTSHQGAMGSGAKYSLERVPRLVL